MQFVVIVGYGRSGTTMLQHALNQADGVLVRGENHNVPFGAWLMCSAAERAKRDHEGESSDSPWYGAPGILLDDFIRMQRDAILKCVIRPDAGTKLCGWKEVRHIPGMQDDRFDDRRFLPANFDELVSYLLFLNRLFPGVRYLINSRSPETASRSSWWADDIQRSRLVLGIANRWFDDLPNVLLDNLGEERCIRVRYEDWSRDPDSLEQAWQFLGLNFEHYHIRKMFSRKVN